MAVEGSNYYPINLQLKGRKCLVVGGGSVAERKLIGLLDAGADEVLLVSPQATKLIRELCKAHNVRFENRKFAEIDLAQAWLVVAATNDSMTNQHIVKLANEKGILSNCVDEPELGSYLTPAVIRKPAVLVAISTKGASPSLAKEIKHELDEWIGDRYSEAVTRIKSLRTIIQEQIKEPQVKKVILQLAAEDVLKKSEGIPDDQTWLDSLLRRIRRD